MSTAVSVMLIVPDADEAVRWYTEALGAELLWDLGGVAGLQIAGAPFFLHETNSGSATERSPAEAGVTSVRVEVFCEHPDALIARAARAGATAVGAAVDHQMPWGPHRQGGFTDPFGHRWSVGDGSPLARHTT